MRKRKQIARKLTWMLLPIYSALFCVLLGLYLLMSASSQTRALTEPFASNSRHVIGAFEVDFPTNCLIAYDILAPIKDFENDINIDSLRICSQENDLLNSLLFFQYPSGRYEIFFQNLKIKTNDLKNSKLSLNLQQEVTIFNGSMVVSVKQDKTLWITQLKSLTLADSTQEVSQDQRGFIVKTINSYLPKTVFN
ncbi:hypothetical protein K2X05_04220 [bacterium]|nr:hypothetical protein [bacterium]